MTSGCIYGLFSFETGLCYYVGQSTDFSGRLKAHANAGRFNYRRHFYAIMESPVEGLRLAERERHWMNHFRGLGHPLENKNDAANSRFARRHKGRYYVLNTGRYHASEKALREQNGISVKEMKEALALSAKTKDVTYVDHWDFVSRRVWLIDLEHAPDWQPAPDYQI